MPWRLGKLSHPNLPKGKEYSRGIKELI